ncbi:MAG: rhodanese-like domain-containing protein [Gammaproteobacteria bacterium]|nr:rhodanese-like domain-containing protein [Gammaproteobacteria bacterium]
MEVEFITQNWYLFLALIVIVFLIAIDPVRKRASGLQPVSAIELPQLVSHQSGIVIDVSEPDEFKQGHIPNAMNVPVSKIDDHLKKLQKYKDKPVVLACSSGQRSNKAAGIFKKHEFTNLYTLTGGLAAWRKENLPVDKE